MNLTFLDFRLMSLRVKKKFKKILGDIRHWKLRNITFRGFFLLEKSNVMSLEKKLISLVPRKGLLDIRFLAGKVISGDSSYQAG